jgi:hypothetical protein
MFTGFGTRTADQKTNQVCMNLIPSKRTNTAAFINDWTPVKQARGRKDSNPMLSGMDDDYEMVLPDPPKF